MTPSCKWPIVTSPLARESKTVLNYGLQGLDSGFQGLDYGVQGLASGFQGLDYGVQGLDSGFFVSGTWIADSSH